MLAFALRPYIGKIFDLNGKPRTAKHLVEDVVECFKVWDGSGNKNKLDFKFQTKEEGQMAKNFIGLFKLDTLKDYHDVTSLTDARWALTHAYLKEKGAPLWALKYCSPMQKKSMCKELCTMIDDILRICEPDGMKNPALIVETLDLIKQYDLNFRELLLVNESYNNFVEGYEQFLLTRDMVNLQLTELEDAKLYIQQNMQAEVGIWTEAEVEEKLKNWRLSKMNKNTIRIVDKIDVEENTQSRFNSSATTSAPNKASQIKIAMAKGRVNSIKNLAEAKEILEEIIDLGYESVFEIINR